MTVLILTLAAGGLALATALLLFPPRPLLATAAALNPEVLFYVDTDTRAVALTFDDGPHPELTPRILDLLDAHGAKATFFVIGEKVPGNEALLARMSAAGHELANHMDADQPSAVLPAAEFARQLSRVDALIRPADGEKWFRPGSGWFHGRMLRQLDEHGYRLSLGSIYPHDTLLPSARFAARFILKRLFAGGVIILHEGRSDRMRTLRVLERILPAIKSRGFAILTLSELTALEN